MSMEAGSTDDKVPKDTTESNAMHVHDCCLKDDREDDPSTLQTPLCKEGNCHSSVPCNLKHTDSKCNLESCECFEDNVTPESTCTCTCVQGKNTGQDLREDAADTRQTKLERIGYLDTIHTPSTTSSTGEGMKQSDMDAVTIADSKITRHPSKGFCKQRTEDDDLYSEIVASTMKIKIFKKYFGDSRRPGICRRPHPKKNYGSFKCQECYLSFNYLPSLLFHRNIHGKKYHIFECSKCCYKSHIPGAYTQHELEHHPEQLYQCHPCNLTFLQKSTLTRHNVALHVYPQAPPCMQKQPLTFVCNLCTAVFYCQLNMTKHLESQHMIANGNSSTSSNLQPANCKQEFFHVILNQKAAPNKQFKVIDSFKCKDCKQVFPGKGMHFIQHRQTVDFSIASVKMCCKWCSFIGSSACKLACHKHKVHFCCLTCNCRHANKELLKQHMQYCQQEITREKDISHSQRKEQLHVAPHEQSNLSDALSTSSNLHQHHPPKAEIQLPPSATGTDAAQHWYCMTCNVIFPTKRLLDLHIKLNHRPMKKVASSQEELEQQPDPDREWRCLLCNTLHPTFQDCDKHQMLHHPDEHEYCPRSDIAEPTLPLIMSALADKGPPYTCNMCDCKTKSIEELHKHKEQFHKVAYSISISNKLCENKHHYGCRFKCGYTDGIKKNVLKHESSCKQGTLCTPSMFSQPSVVLDASSGKMVVENASTSGQGECKRQSEETVRDNALQSTKLNCPKEMPLDGNKSVLNIAASADTLRNVHPSECGTQSVVDKHRDDSLKAAHTKPQQSQPVPIVQHSCLSQSQQQPLKTASSANVQTCIPVKVIEADDKKKSKDDSHRNSTSSSGDESNSCFGDKSSGSEYSPSAESVSTDSMASEEENLHEESNHVDQAQLQTAQLTQDKPVFSPPKMCPPLLQPAVLMRFFQAIDMSDLYRLALQMITGSPQPHTLPMSDPAMLNSSTVHFKYKIPLGYSHSEFQETPLFPSSQEVLKLDYMQTLPSSMISKHYKGVFPKPFHKHFSSMVDSAIIAQFKESTLKNIERFVRKQRIDDRKDITLSLSQYIVSQYFKNQQKKTQNKQVHSSFGVNLASTGNSPGAGPSCTQKQPAPIHLLISPSALQGNTTPITTVKVIPTSMSSRQIKANMTRKLIVSENVHYFVKSVQAPTPAAGLSAAPGTLSNADSVEKKCTKSSNECQESKANCNESGIRKGAKHINLKSEVSCFQSTQINKRRMKNIPLRRSARLCKNSYKLESSVAAESIPAVPRQSPNRDKKVDMHGKIKDNEGPKAKKSKMPIKRTIDHCQRNNQDRSMKKKNPLIRRRCKERRANKVDNQSDNDAPETKSELSKNVLPLSIENTAVSKSESKSSIGELDCSTNIQTLHMVQEPMIPDINIDSKRHVFHGSLLSNATDGDGVLETRISRRPLHGLNVSVMQMHDTTSLGANVFRQVSLNGKICKTQTASINIEEEMPDLNKLIAEPPMKAVKQSTSIATERPGHNPGKQTDHQNVNSLEEVSAIGRCDELNTSSLTYSMPNIQPCKEQLPPSIPAKSASNNTGKTWKKTVNKHEVLAMMAKRRTWRCAPYKTLTYTNVNKHRLGYPRKPVSGEINLKSFNTANNLFSQIHSKNKDTVDFQGQSLEKYDDSHTNMKKMSNEDEGTSCMVLDVSHHLKGPKETLSNSDMKYCEENTTYCQNVMFKEAHACQKSKGRLKLTKTVMTCPDDNGEAHALETGALGNQAENDVQQESSFAAKELSSKVCDVKESFQGGEKTCTRRSLRNKKLKMEAGVSNCNTTMPTEKAVDHSYIKLRRSNSNCTAKTRLASHHVNVPKKIKYRQAVAKGKTDISSLIVPHDHSYTGNKQQKNTNQTKGKEKMDHCYYWKIDNEDHLHQGSSHSEMCTYKSELTKKECTNSTDDKQTRSRDITEEHKRTRLSDHSYSTTFPKQVQEQIAAMDHCYIKLTPINLDSNPKCKGSVEDPFAITNPSTMKGKKRAGSPISNVQSRKKFSKHKLGQRWTGKPSKRELRPRSIESHYK